MNELAEYSGSTAASNVYSSVSYYNGCSTAPVVSASWQWVPKFPTGWESTGKLRIPVPIQSLSRLARGAIHSLFDCTNDFNEYPISGDYVSHLIDFKTSYDSNHFHTISMWFHAISNPLNEDLKSYYCILDFERNGPMISLVNGPSVWQKMTSRSAFRCAGHGPAVIHLSTEPATSRLSWMIASIRITFFQVFIFVTVVHTVMYSNWDVR